jgi:hypothetical protein
MRRQMMWLGLSLMVALCLTAGRLPAQDIVPAQRDVQVFVVPIVPYEPTYHPPLPAPYFVPPPPGPASHRLHGLLNQHGMACQSNARWGACGNFHYDCAFIFGSCRSFFGERCDPLQHYGNHGHNNGYQTGYQGSNWFNGAAGGCGIFGCNR